MIVTRYVNGEIVSENQLENYRLDSPPLTNAVLNVKGKLKSHSEMRNTTENSLKNELRTSSDDGAKA